MELNNLEFFEQYEHEFNFQYLQKVSDDEWVFRCPICGDSVEVEDATRGHLKFDWNVFKCFRCGVKLGIDNFIKEASPHVYSEYLRFKFRDTIRFKEDDFTPTTKVIEKVKQVFEFKPIDYFMFQPINSSMTSIVEYLESRYLDVNNFLFDPKSNRIAIPYYNKEKEIYYYQLRSIQKNVKNKYMFDKTRNVNENNIHRNIYNIYNIDVNKPIQLLEGAIDSQLVENSIGNSGIGNIESNLKFIIDNFSVKKNNLYLLLDFDTAGFEHMIKLSPEYYVFDWIAYLKDMELDYASTLDKLDINQLYGDLQKDCKFKFKEFEKYYVKYSRQLEHKYKSLIRRIDGSVKRERRLFKE